MTQQLMELEQFAGVKVKNTILSCITEDQLKTAEKMAENFYKKYGNRDLFKDLIGKKRESIQKGGAK